MPETQPRKGKNIVVCCDGTGNQFNRENSNVVKLYAALTVDNDQTAYYHPGVGTMGAPTARTAAGRAWSTVTGLAFATGFMDNVEDAYRYLMNTYDDGDRIYLFGFSRGAYTARALASLLDGYGLLCRGNESHIPYMLRLFQTGMKQARSAAKKARKTGATATTSISLDAPFKEVFSHDVHLHFVGLWDTVSSVGLITQPLRLLYSAQNRIIHYGRHAISLDERRSFFQDNLWGEPLPMSRTPSLYDLKRDENGEFVRGENGDIERVPLQQDILQVWFPGVHSDVGGGYDQKVSILSNNSLRWLLDEAKSKGLLINPDRELLIFGLLTRKKYEAAVYLEKPTVSRIHPSLHGPWWILECLWHRHYTVDNAPENREEWTVPFGAFRTVPNNSIVHFTYSSPVAEPAGYTRPNLAAGTLSPLPDSPIDPETKAPIYLLYQLPSQIKTKGTQPALPVKRIAAMLAILTGAVAFIIRRS
jgi:uncharacterized protein (DUF2235 family)